MPLVPFVVLLELPAELPPDDMPELPPMVPEPWLPVVLLYRVPEPVPPMACPLMVPLVLPALPLPTVVPVPPVWARATPEDITPKPNATANMIRGDIWFPLLLVMRKTWSVGSVRKDF